MAHTQKNEYEILYGASHSTCSSAAAYWSDRYMVSAKTEKDAIRLWESSMKEKYNADIFGRGTHVYIIDIFNLGEKNGEEQ